MQDRRTALVAAISALIVLAVIAWAVVRSHHASPQLQAASSAPQIKPLQAGSRAPEFRIPSTAGVFDLDAQRRPALVEIFASWCPHCQRETVIMNQLFSAFKNKIAFIAIPGSLNGMDGSSPESEGDLLNFIGRFHVLYPVAVFDPQLTAADEYIQGGYPTIAVIGANKRILFISDGEIPYATLAAQLQRVR
jgi:thiol-disulfide isomerase/thioredoxin